MTEVVSNLELRFGLPTTREKEERINKIAIECGISVEKALISEFEDMFTNNWMRADGENIFELLLLIATGERVSCREVMFGTYQESGTQYPKATILADYLNLKNSSRRIWVNDEVIEGMGKELDANFEYEFVEFLRIRK